MPLSVGAVHHDILLGDHGPLVAQGNHRVVVPYGHRVVVPYSHLGAVPYARHLINYDESQVENLGRMGLTHVSTTAHVPVVIAMPLIVVLIMMTTSSS